MTLAHQASPQADGDSGHETIADRVIAEIAAALSLDRAEVLPRCSLVHDFGASMRDMGHLWKALELAFNLTIPMHQANQWRTVESVVAYISARVQGPEAA